MLSVTPTPPTSWISGQNLTGVRRAIETHTPNSEWEEMSLTLFVFQYAKNTL